jgi:hypothetical protein
MPAGERREGRRGRMERRWMKRGDGESEEERLREEGNREREERN